MKISAIVAVATNGVIGKNGQLPWKIPEDLKRFKELTMGHAVCMGRKTFQSIGRPLPGRRNIVLSRGNFGPVPGIDVMSAVEEVRKSALSSGESELFILGGAEVYNLFSPLIDRYYVSEVQQDFEGDAFFKIPNQESFQCTVEEKVSASVPFVFKIYDKRK